MGQTTANEASVELSDVPSIQSFQFEADPFGQIKKSVNLFRGDVNLPLVLASLEADTGLSVSITAIYDGAACHHVDVWNRDSPTGILGLGWSLPVEQVIAARAGAASDAATRYYLRTASSASEMIPSGVDTDGALLFQLQGYQFWRIRYVTRLERWEVTKENGVTSIYGGSTTPGSSDGDSIQWGVAFGNWMMSSAQTNGQSQIPATWNLRQVVSPHGQTVTYAYDAVTQKVGSAGKAYTKACYLASITDSAGRTISLVYGDKLYKPGQICEYQDPHKQTPDNTPNAYQSCYETRYLDQIVVRAGDGVTISSVAFSYDFFNASSGSDPAHAYLYKRVLTAIHQRNAHGDPLPGMLFEYNAPRALAQGMLKGVTYPQGAKASYGYSALSLPSARQERINNPFTGATPGVPRVWHGADYTIVTWVDTVGKRLQVSTYSWSGRWVDWTPANTDNAQVDLTTLEVVTGGDFFAVFYRDLQTSQGVLQLYRRDPTQFGAWTRTTQTKTMTAGTARATIAAGEDFVVVASPLFSGGPYLSAWWDWRRGAWTTPALPSVPLASPAQLAVAGVGNAYLVCSYNPGNKTGSYQLISLDDGQWTTRGWNASMDVLQGSGDFPLTWSVLPSGAVATYLSTFTASTATGRMLTFQWDTDFNPISPSSPIITNLTTPVVNGEMVVNLLATASAGVTVGNGATLSRFVGGGVTNWANTTLETTISTSATYAFAYGPDASAMVKTIGGTTTASFSSFNPNIPNSGGWSQPISVSQASSATVSEGLATLGQAIYQQQVNGAWIKTGGLLVAQGRQVDPASIQNRAPDYIAYQDNGGANTVTYVALVQNGVVGSPISLAPDPQRVTTPTGGPGQNLAGALAFVTYPAGSSFDAALYLTLYRVVDRAVTGTVVDAPVTSISVTNGFDDAVNPTLQQAYRYVTAGMTFDTASGLAQFPMVSMIGGVTDPNGPTPYGRTDYYFSNGLSSAARSFYSAGWIWNYSGLLNGALLATTARDATGVVVSTDVSWYKVYTSTTGMPNLYGAYARRVRATALSDGVHTMSETQYDSSSGLPTIVTSTSYLGGTTEHTYRQTTTYAYQVPTYASAMRAAWALSLPAEILVENDGTPVSAKATTYRNWSGGQDWKWAAETSCTWSGAGQSVFDFTVGASNPDWFVDSTVLARDPSGRIAASADAMGLVTSYLFDTSGHFQIAGFTNADVTQNQAGFAGFESYDPITGWTLGSGATITEGDAHTGERALTIPAGVTGLSRDLIAGAGDMLLTAWVKTPQGFAQDGGTAQWEIAVAGQTTLAPIADTAGVWAPIVARVPVPMDATNPTVTARCVNGKATASFLIDDVRIGPFVGGFSARALDIDRRQVTARLDGALATRKYRYDSYALTLATLGPGLASASVQQLMSDAFSRETDVADSFNPAAPNMRHTLSAMGPSAYLDLESGTPLTSQYVADPPANWATSGGAVRYAGSSPGSLVASDGALTPPCLFRFSLDAPSALQHPLAIGLSQNGADTASVTFDPATALYTLVVGETTMGSVGAPILALPASASATLDQGAVTDDIVTAFSARGWPLTTSASVEVRAQGASWTITQDARCYYVLADGGALAVTVIARQWTLAVGVRSLIFIADGVQLFGVTTPTTLAGAPTLRAADPVGFSNLMIATQPQIAVGYIDGVGRKIQAQSIHDDTAIVQQSVYDAVGNGVAQTKAAAVAPPGEMLLGYAPGFVTAFDRATGVMAGQVADAHPEDEGYPYSGTRFETSPLARPVEAGKAGKAFAIDLTQPVDQRHTTRFEYGTNGSENGLPPGQYRTTTTISPRGGRGTSYVDKTARVEIGKTMGDGAQALKTFYIYDALGNVSTVRTPNYYAPPAQTTADDWVMTFTYDARGAILSQSTANQGQTQFVYDPSGRLRFTTDAEGAANGYVVYNKYDVLGRPIETGAYSTSLTRAQLQDKADNDPSWPQGAPWQKRIQWDGDGATPATIGQIAVCETASATPGTADVVESFSYDIAGRVLTKRSQAGGQDFSFVYTYDAYGNVVAIDYPQTSGVGRVTYTIDDLARIVGVGVPQQPTAYSAYVYGSDGGVDTETFQPASPIPIIRTVGHNSPGWISSVTASTPSGSIFAETVNYTSGGWPNDQGWYDGSVAALDFDYAHVEDPYAYRLDYDDQGQLTAAKDTVDSTRDFGIASPVVYDANGNIRGSSVGTVVLDYSYAAGSGDRLQTIQSSDPTLARVYGYDLKGNVVSIAGGRDLTIGYDRTTSLPVSVTTASATTAYAYDGGGRRITKTGPTPKVYGYGTSPQPLVEWIGQSATPTSYVYGPAGLAAVIKDGQTHYVFRDHERSPRVLCGTDGVASASFDYWPFGAVARETGDGALIDRRFTGQEFDPETGLYNYRSRLYDAEVGRFLAPDAKNQFFSPYIYAANNPLSFVDPTGQFAILAALVEGLVDLIGLAVVAGETTETVATVSAVSTSLVEGGEAVAVGSEALSVGSEVVSSSVTVSESVAVSDSLVASTVESTTTSLSEVSSLGIEGSEVEGASIGSLESSSSALTPKYYSPLEWLNITGDQGGYTTPIARNWTRWPLTYLNRWGLTAYDAVVTNLDTPGTFGYLDTAAHEGFHAALYRYAPFITWAENATVGGVNIGAPVLWAEETVAYSVGNLAAGRIFAVPLAPIAAFGSLSGPQSVVTLSAMAVVGAFMLL